MQITVEVPGEAPKAGAVIELEKRTDGSWVAVPRISGPPTK